MYRTHIQCADVGRAAWPKLASLSARGLNSGVGESTTQTVSRASGNAGQGVRGAYCEDAPARAIGCLF